MNKNLEVSIKQGKRDRKPKIQHLVSPEVKTKPLEIPMRFDSSNQA